MTGEAYLHNTVSTYSADADARLSDSNAFPAPSAKERASSYSPR